MEIKGLAEGEARARRAFDAWAVVLFAAIVGSMAVGSIHTLAGRGVFAIGAFVFLATTLYLLRYLKPAWRPCRTQPFGANLLCLALIVVPSSLAGLNPLMSLLIGVMCMFSYLAFMSFREAFIADRRGICSRVALASILGTGSVLAVALRMGFHAAGLSDSALPWFCLAPSDLGGASFFEHLYTMFLVTTPALLLGMGCILKSRGRFLLLAATLVAGCGILLSFSRAAWISLIFELAVLVLLVRRVRIPALVTGSAVLALWLAIPGGVSRARTIAEPGQRTNAKRIVQWGVALELLADAPLTGHGPGMFSRAYRLATGVPAQDAPTCPNNVFLHVAAECGVPGFLIFLAWAYHIFRFVYWRKVPEDQRPEDDDVLRPAALATVGGLFIFMFFHL
jgi:O-antigen ligase